MSSDQAEEVTDSFLMEIKVTDKEHVTVVSVEYCLSVGQALLI